MVAGGPLRRYWLSWRGRPPTSRRPRPRFFAVLIQRAMKQDWKNRHFRNVLVGDAVRPLDSNKRVSGRKETSVAEEADQLLGEHVGNRSPAERRRAPCMLGLVVVAAVRAGTRLCLEGLSREAAFPPACLSVV